MIYFKVITIVIVNFIVDINFLDEQINEELKPWKATIESVEGQIFGTTKVPLEKKECKYEECLFGNLVTDLMVYSVCIIIII